MDTALVITPRTPARPLRAWLATHLPRRHPRAEATWTELAELHERQVVAARLRDEQFRSIAVGRLI
ncbi:hypothetical protein [Agromyces sp. NPDC058110]|uniref:hypothetical protein n=1 Tax=Agromyces sp. NPDC058110 TaxID=3346345 RepID=UPI0036DF2DB6